MIVTAAPRATAMGMPAGPRPKTAAATTPQVVDLPAPITKPRASMSLDLPAPVSKRRGIMDLPAPVKPPPRPDLPAPVRNNKASILDLPAPVTSKPSLDQPPPIDLPAPVRNNKASILDLPAPVAPTQGTTDLLAPAQPGKTGHTGNLPSPVGAKPTKSLDLPTPVGSKPTMSLDLPSPVGPSPRALDLPTPVGPNPSAAPPPVPSQGSKLDLPAPKGFFDDVPAPLETRGQGKPQKLDLPAPKGFFDDVPAPLETRGQGKPQKLDLPAPKGFFDDVPAPLEAKIPTPAASATSLLAEQTDSPPLALNLDGPQSGSDEEPLQLQLGNESNDTLGFTRNDDHNDAYQAQTSDLGKIELDHDAAKDIGQSTAGHTVANAEPTATKAKSKKKSKKKASGAGLRKIKAIVTAAILVVGIAGAGGYWLYQQNQESERKIKRIAKLLKQVRAEMRIDKPNHWERATKKALSILKIDPENGDALGLAAQAPFAAYLDEGTKLKERLASGNKAIREINESSLHGPEIDKAEALRALLEGQHKLAIDTLSAVIKKHRSDSDAYLYLGWAHAATGNYVQALKAYKKALSDNPNRIPVLYGIAQAQSGAGNLKEARAAYRKVIDRTRDDPNLSDHIGALVGSAQLARSESFTARENRLREILNRKDVEELLSQSDEAKQKIDTRAVSLAFALAGDHALRAGRIDEAKQRYDSAERLDPNNLKAPIGRAKAALSENRYGAARQILEEIIKKRPNHLGSHLVLANVAIAETKLSEAQEHLETVKKHPQIQNPANKLRMALIQGQIYEANPNTLNKAIKEYEIARELVGDDDIRPTVALAGVLGKLERPQEAISLLKPIKSKAEQDPSLAITLGLAYRAAGEAATAEEWFRTALRRKPKDVEAQFQLGLAIYEQERIQDAIDTLNRAYETDEAREDVGLRLAIILEQHGRDGQAEDLYKKLLNGRSPSINVKVRAGRYFVRKGEVAIAAELGTQILNENENHPGGLFLKGEGLIHEGKFQDAISVLKEAVKTEPIPQYIEGLGRAYERTGSGGYDSALLAYQRASKMVPNYLEPRLGMARIRIARADCEKAIPVVNEILAIDPTHAWSYFRLGTCYAKQRKFKAAIDAYQQAIRLKPNHADSYYHIGRAYSRMDKSKAAAKALAKATDLAEKSPGSSSSKWLTEAYRLWGAAEWSHENRRNAIYAWERYLARQPKNPTEVRDVKKLLLRLKAR